MIGKYALIFKIENFNDLKIYGYFNLNLALKQLNMTFLNIIKANTHLFRLVSMDQIYLATKKPLFVALKTQPLQCRHSNPTQTLI